MTTTDATGQIRRDLLARGVPTDELEAVMAKGGEVWDPDELRRDFTVKGFMAPLVVVVRKADGVEGSLMFTHSPRFYFGFEPV